MGYLLGKLFRFFLVIYVGVFFFLLVRPNPAILAHDPSPVDIAPSAVTFLSDSTYTAKDSGAIRVEESIVPAILEMVKGAKEFVYADMFLFNEFQGSQPQTYRKVTTELAEALIAKKSGAPSSTIVFMTDPINRGYGGIVNPELDRMEKAGVHVYETPLDRLRDSNLAWSTVYRMFFAWFPNSTTGGLLPNPLDAGGAKVTLRTYAHLFNFKANHRKILVTDGIDKGGKTLVSLVGSLNPHTASSVNGNVALQIKSASIGGQILASEGALLSLGEFPPITSPQFPEKIASGSGVTAAYLTEVNIEKSLISTIDRLSGEGSRLDIAVFYLSDRNIIAAIKRAEAKNVKIRVLLDSNDSAFGHRKYGIPNRQTLEELLTDKKENLSLRWCNTHGEQCHAKMLIATADGKSTLIVGSANYTRRNLNRYNLESAIMIESTVPMKALADAYAYMDRTWNNTKGDTSVDAEVYRDRASWKRLVAWIMEQTGLSTF